jgi:hypothetical protein
MLENAAESHPSSALPWAGQARPSSRKKRGRRQIQYTYPQPELQAEQITLAARLRTYPVLHDGFRSVWFMHWRHDGGL